MATDYSKSTLADLQAQFIALGDQLSALAEQRRAINDEINARFTKVAAMARIANMSLNELDALKAVVDDPATMQAAALKAGP